MKRRLFFILMAAMTMTFTGCRDKWPYYHCYKTVNHEKWFTGDKVELNVPTVEADTALHLALCLRTTETYSYQHLFLNLTVRDDSTNQIKKCLSIKVPVFDDNGLAIGKGFPYMEAEYDIEGYTLRLQKGHAYTITLAHDMRAATIHGVSDIGVKLF